MATPRRKAPRQLAPQTIEEATALLAEYADILLGVEELRQDADASIAAIEAERDRMIAPMEQRAKDLFLQARAWWGVAGGELTEGKRKSVELAGCHLGERTTPHSLKMPAGAEASAEILMNAGLAQFCRAKINVDKPSVIKELTTLPALVEQQRAGIAAGTLEFETAMALANRIATATKLGGELGFRAVQKEEFFIDRAGAKPAATEEVADPAAQDLAGQ